MTDISSWMLVDYFTVHQAAVLWGGLDPSQHSHSLGALPSEAMGIKQMLFGAILGEELKVNSECNALSIVGNHSDSIVARAELENFARSKNQFPKFLFDTLSPFATPPSTVELLRMANRSQTPHAQTTQSSEARTRGGRPAEYDWDSFIFEIIRIANSIDGLPDKQAELANRMLEWFSNNYGSEPAESTIRSKISKIYKYLDHTHKNDENPTE